MAAIAIMGVAFVCNERVLCQQSDRGETAAAAALSGEVTPEFVNRLSERMRSNHPALKAAAARADAARAGVDSVRVWREPMVTLGMLAADAGMRADEGDIIYGFEQPLPLFSRAKANRAVAQAELTVEQAASDYLFQSLRRDLAKALFKAALAERVVEVGTEDLMWLETLEAVGAQRYVAGDITQVQLLRVQNELSKRREDLLTDQQKRAREWAAINRLLSQNAAEPWPGLILPPLAGPMTYSERLVEFALKYEPRLKLFQQQLRQAAASVALARRQRLPEASFETELRNASRDAAFRQAMIKLNLSLPWLNDRKYRNDIRREEDKARALQLDMADYELSVREEVFRLVLNIDAARREAVLYGEMILPRSEQALASARAAWLSGKGMLTDVLEGRRMAIEAHLMRARALAEQYEMLSELVLCCGLGDLEALYRLGVLSHSEPAPNTPPKPE